MVYEEKSMIGSEEIRKVTKYIYLKSILRASNVSITEKRIEEESNWQVKSSKNILN